MTSTQDQEIYEILKMIQLFIQHCHPSPLLASISTKMMIWTIVCVCLTQQSVSCLRHYHIHIFSTISIIYHCCNIRQQPVGLSSSSDINPTNDTDVDLVVHDMVEPCGLDLDCTTRTIRWVSVAEVRLIVSRLRHIIVNSEMILILLTCLTGIIYIGTWELAGKEWMVAAELLEKWKKWKTVWGDVRNVIWDWDKDKEQKQTGACREIRFHVRGLRNRCLLVILMTWLLLLRCNWSYKADDKLLN